VAVGHVTELAALAPEELDPIVGRLRERDRRDHAAGHGLYLMGRKGRAERAARLGTGKKLLAAGVAVAASSNNVRNAFTPVGNANLALMGTSWRSARTWDGAGDPRGPGHAPEYPAASCGCHPPASASARRPTWCSGMAERAEES